MTSGILIDTDAHPVPLELYLFKGLGISLYEWEPETLWLEIPRVYRVSPPEINRHKIQAIRAVHMSDGYSNDWGVFEKVLHPLTGVFPMFGMLQKPTVGQLMAGMETMQILRKIEFDPEIWQYVAAVLLNDGITFAPGILSGAEEYLPGVLRNEIKTQYNSKDTSEDTPGGWQALRLKEAARFAEVDRERMITQLEKLKDEPRVATG